MAQTLFQLLGQRSAERSADLAYATSKDGTSIAQSLTYSELEQRALALAAFLQQRLSLDPSQRERILMLLPPGLDVPVAFYGIVAGGAVAVPAPPPEPSQLKRALPRLSAIVRSCGARCALTTHAIGKAMAGLGDSLPAELRDLDWIDLADVPRDLVAAHRDPALGADELAYLQYTSGSTSEPRGARITHAQLLANCAAAHRAWGYDPEAIAVNWMPYFHDYGLVEGLLQPLHAGVPVYLLSPLTFLKRPDRWLRAIATFRATHSSAPNFAYEHCLVRIKDPQLAGLDLSSWRTAGVGAEVIRPATLERFARRFAPYGFRPTTFYPSYGLAEATLLVTTKAGGEEPRLRTFDAEALRRHRAVEVAAEITPEGGAATQQPRDRRTLVGCGQAIAGVTLEIVDPETLRPCGREEVGEVWVAGPSIAAGYWDEPEASTETFGARLADGRGPYLRTGDLGCRIDGELYITGRRKELILLAGVNHYPEDLEWSVEDCHPSLRHRGTIAFSVDRGDEERLILASEVERGELADAEVIAAIRRAVAERHEVEIDTVMLLRRGAIPKTSSGKLQRSACREAFLAGQLEAVAEWHRAPRSAVETSLRDASSIADWLRHRLAERTGADAATLSLDEPFASYGLASLQAVALVAELEEHLGRELPETLLFSYPTIAAAAARVADDPVGSEGRRGRRASPVLGGGRQLPIAVIGMACRLPGAPDIDAYWRLLREGVDAVREIPPDRWDVDAYFDPEPSTPGKMITRWGGFLEGIDLFDAPFFGISPREACHLDPRQRMMLEVGWEALEDAGLTPESLAGSDTGVFVATLIGDYGRLLFNQFDLAIDAYSGPGTAHSVVANRLSYFLDLRGPSMALDTACSGSLVSLHLAAQSLERGECSLAIAGGVSVLIEPGANIFFSKAGAMAPDGRCKTFDRRADGIVRGEGIGLVVLKPLERALADGDPILATLLGSAVNHDGRSNGIMAPNGEAQEALLRSAYRRAGVAPRAVQYIEAHGTGTPLGDPIETTALGAVLGEGRDAEHPFAIGSVKTNLGHLEPAAGIAGVLKVILAMQHRQLPPTLHFEEINPLIPCEQLKLRVQQSLGPWPADAEPLIAGVSGFGIGGSNAHVVLGEAPKSLEATATAAEDGPCLLPISARSADSLARLGRSWTELLRSGTAPHPRDLCATAARRRSHHPHRLAVVGDDSEELAAALESRLEAGLDGAAPRRREPRLVWVFSGQGTHWVGMAGALRRRWPVVEEALREVDERFLELSGRSLLAALDDAALLEPTETAQPAIFAMQVALARLWRSWGLEPAAVLGQSLGEVAAAHVAGALDLAAAVRVVYHRSRLMASAEGQGETAVVALSFDDAAALLEELAIPTVALAGSTSPATSILAGDPESLAVVLEALVGRGVFCRRLAGVRLAFHSPQMDPLVGPLEAALEGLEARATHLPLVSSVRGRPIEGEELDAAYWGANLRQPFRFAQAVGGLVEAGLDSFLEIGPHAVLEGALRQCLGQGDRSAGKVVSTMRRDQEPLRSTATAAAALYEAGHPLDWDTLVPAGRTVRLPRYPWQRERFWIDQVAGAGSGPATAARLAAGSGHPLLGERFDLAPPSSQTVWQIDLGPETLHYLDEHKVHDVVVLPGTTYLEMALAALRARRLWGDKAESDGAEGDGAALDGWEVVEVRFEQALFLTPGHPRRVQLALASDGDGATFTISSRPREEAGTGPWQVHARGRLRPSPLRLADEAVDPEDLIALRRRCTEQRSAEEHYQRMSDLGFGYGPSFRVVAELWRREGEVLGHLQVPAHLQAETARYAIHPVVLDGGLQLVAATLPEDTDATFLPVGAGRLRLAGPIPHTLWCHCLRTASAEGQEHAHARFLDSEGRCVAEIEGLRFQRLDATRETIGGERDWRWQVQWEGVPAPVPDGTGAGPGAWLLLGDKDLNSGRGSVAKALEERLERLGATVHRVGLDAIRDAALDHRENELESFFRRALAELTNGQPVRGVVHLWSLDLAETGELDPRRLSEAMALGCGVLPALVRALVGHGGATPPRLWLVTRGAQPVAGAGAEADLAIARTPLWGVARALAYQEHPALWGRLIDLDPADTPRAAAAVLAAELSAGADPEDTVGYRDGQRRASRLRRYPKAKTAPPRWRLDATYLITGGLGGLGLAVARRMVEGGARRLILLGRSPLPERGRWAELSDDHPAAPKVAAVRELETLGASVHTAAVDVADADDLARFLAAFRSEAWPPIRGVIHSAGVVRDRLVEKMSFEDFRTVAVPKILGAWNLHEQLADEPLDVFVLFSSAAAILTPPGQGAYAAGNAFLDALAHLRRARGLPGLSLNWGPWGEIGMAARLQMADSLALSGALPLDPAGALESFEQSLSEEIPQLALFSADWPKLLDRFFPAGVEPPIIAHLRDQGTPGEPRANGGEKSVELRAALRGVEEPAELRAQLLEHLIELTSEVLGLDAGRIETDQPLSDLGFDSIMAVELKTSIEASLGVSIPMVEWLQGPSLLEVASRIGARLRTTEAAPT